MPTQAYYNKNRESLIAKVKEWNNSHKEHRKLYRKKYNEEYKEEITLYAKKYREKRYEYFQQYWKDYYAKNRKRELKQNSEWYKNNKDWAVLKEGRRRAIYKGGNCTIHDWKKIKEKYEYICLCCGKKKELTIDHIIPLCKGGRHDKENIQPLCLICNIKKNTKTIDYRSTDA